MGSKFLSVFFVTAALFFIWVIAPGFDGNSKDNAVGEQVRDLVYNNPEGEPMRLSELRGKMVLISFWASWCGPCRRENPRYVSVYKQFKDARFVNGNGFTIYGVSLDRNRDAWAKAIEEDGLPWEYHVSDLQGWQSEPAGYFEINSIPANVLIDGDGVILAKNIRGEALVNFLDNLKQ